MPDRGLSAEELARRRALERRRRARRRGVLAAVLLVIAVALVAIVIGGTSSAGRTTATHPDAAVKGVRSVAQRPPHRAPANLERAIGRVLAYTSYVQLAGHRRPDVALTFDDGPSSFTPEILRILIRMHAAATFFVIGRSARTYPQFVAEEARDGFVVGDHTEDHPPLAELSPSSQSAQLTDAASAIQQAGAPYPHLFRPPYGSFNGTTLATAGTLHMLMVLWSADTSDYSRPGVSRIVYVAVSGAQPGAIILMHDGGGDRSQTVAALPRIITRLRERHFQLVTVPQLVADDPPPRDQPAPHPLSGGI
jgi:peptidoglycan-N-acetylglucosamine deacetylase